MSRKKLMSEEDLVAMFIAKATAPPPEVNRLLMRHLQCKESMHLAGAFRDALGRYPGDDPVPLPAPSMLLPPLM